MTFVSKIKFAKKLIKEYLEKYPNKYILACSFGKDSMVLYHLARQVKKDIPVFSVMTPFKFKETFKYKARMEKKYRMNIKTYIRDERTDVLEWWKSNPDECCNYYKVEPTKEALKDYDVWFTGLRKDEGRTRINYDYVETRGNIIKINPILDFTEKDIWRYMALYKIPANPLYKKGYRSLGCESCSNKERSENETERFGRWKGTSKCGGECGIHTQELK